MLFYMKLFPRRISEDYIKPRTIPKEHLWKQVGHVCRMEFFGGLGYLRPFEYALE